MGVQLTNPRNGKKYKVEFVVVKNGNADVNLIGSIVAQRMNLIQVNHENLLAGSSEVAHLVQAPSATGLSEKEIRTKYADMFQGLGELGEPLHLEVHESIKPVQILPRRIPEALRKLLKEHLKELEQQGVIEKVVECRSGQQEKQWKDKALPWPAATKQGFKAMPLPYHNDWRCATRPS